MQEQKLLNQEGIQILIEKYGRCSFYCPSFAFQFSWLLKLLNCLLETKLQLLNFPPDPRHWALWAGILKHVTYKPENPPEGSCIL